MTQVRLHRLVQSNLDPARDEEDHRIPLLLLGFPQIDAR